MIPTKNLLTGGPGGAMAAPLAALAAEEPPRGTSWFKIYAEMSGGTL